MKNITLIQEDSIRIVEELVKKSELFSEKSNIKHPEIKGSLREIFISNVLNLFLPSHFGVGSGIIINHLGDQSGQTDIIVYDKRILPPFIQSGRIGIFPAESVIATIEVKSYLRSVELKNAESSAKKLHEEIYKKEGFKEGFSCNSNYVDNSYINLIKPICCVIGLRQNDNALFKRLLSNNSDSRGHLKKIKYLSAICHVKKYSWINFDRPEYTDTNYTGWKYDANSPPQETIRFVAIIVDRIRTLSEIRLNEFSNSHHNWISIYTRNQ